jgi:hypothetical protein
MKRFMKLIRPQALPVRKGGRPTAAQIAANRAEMRIFAARGAAKP